MEEIIVLSPADWAAVELEISKQSGLIIPERPPSTTTLWGLPVVVSNEVPSGKAIIGDLSRIDTTMRCECCGTRATEKGCLGGGLPVCVCYLQTGGETPALCSDCENCAFHHNGLPFGACKKSDLAQRVIRTRLAEAQRRQAEENYRHGS